MADSGQGRRIAIAGIATHWGTELARRLSREASVERIFGIDTQPPGADLERVEWLDADIRSPLLSRVLPSTRVDTVVHCGVHTFPGPGRPVRALHDINLIGTLQLLAACERTPELERVLVRGSATIYGSEPAAPSFFTEEMARAFPLRTRFQRDIGELEAYFENFARRHPELVCCMLRYQPELGPELRTPLSRYLALPVVPTQLGFDPRLQFLHSADATDALLRATLVPIRGAVNVAPAGSISLSRALRMIGRTPLPIPHPLFGPALRRVAGPRGGRGVGGLQGPYGDAVRLLRYGRGIDNRRLREELGFVPAFDAVETIRDFGRQAGSPRLAPGPGIGAALSRVAREPR